MVSQSVSVASPTRPAGRSSKPKLGELLVQLKFISQAQLSTALAHQKQWGLSLGRAILHRGLCTEAQLMTALSLQLKMPLIELDNKEVDVGASTLIPRKFAE